MNPQQYSVKDVDDLCDAVKQRMTKRNERILRAFLENSDEFDGEPNAMEVLAYTQLHMLAGHKAADIKAQTEAESNG